MERKNRRRRDVSRGQNKGDAGMKNILTLQKNGSNQRRNSFFSKVVTKNARAEAPAFRHGEEARAPLILKQLNM